MSSVTEDTPLTKATRGDPASNDSIKTIDLNYDRAAKIVLSDRRIIARILQRVIEPYKDLSIDEIMPLILENTQDDHLTGGGSSGRRASEFRRALSIGRDCDSDIAGEN